ncbi:Type IV pilus biogenesis protein PilQ [gamma proteobacterium IMCC1989]|nr:Type IV pilus biogenesis protein PilQ [gamma proteobacterium IMCC1989]
MLRLRIIIFCAITVFSIQAFSAIEMQNVAFSELPGSQVEIRVSFSGSPSIPKGYSIERPARIVLDFPSVKSALPQKKYPLGFGGVRSAVILTAKERTRMIINLSNIVTYSTEVLGRDLVIVLNSSQIVSSSISTNQKIPATVSDESNVISKKNFLNQITDVDFRRDDKGAGTLLLSLSNPKVAVDIERNAKKISMLFSNTGVGDELQRRLDVIDFATPVKFIETRRKNNNVSVSIETEGQYEYLAYQADGTYVVSISPLTSEEVEQQKERFSFVGEKLSLNFQDIEVRKVLEIIADFTELNLVASDTVSGNITLRLENVPWDQALELVLKSKGLDKRQSGNVLLVAPAAEIAERERQELESRKQLQELEPLRTEFILIRYAKAQDVLTLISSGSDQNETAEVKNILSARGSAVVDERTNAIILTDIDENIRGIKSLINKVDVPVRQVMIEARIVSATDTFMEEFGFFVGASDTSTANNPNLTTSALSDATVFNPVGSVLDVSYVSNGVSLALEIQALEDSGYGEVVSQPRVLTGDKQTAKISSGQQIPFTSSDGDTVTTIFQDAVLSLEVTPQITPDNRIIMELKVNRDSLDTSTVTVSGSPINVTELTTTALVGDGDTIVLGGIYEQTKTSSVSKVPVLGDIPVLGRLFTSNTDQDDRTELLIFITPRILTDRLIDE